MNPSTRPLIRLCSTLFAGLALAASVAAQTFPSKPVTMIVAFPAGGGSDVLGRAVGKGMSEAFGQPVIVENVVGVGGSLGVLKAANAQPDGYTILAGSPLELIYTPLGLAAAKNKPEDMRLAALVGHTPIAIVVRKDLPVNTLHKAAYTALGNPEIRKVIETAGSTVAEPMSLAQLDAVYKQEALRGAAIAKSIKLQPQ
jgi:tripartite-type tricarboxylate transporter receptor subunit TctC